MSNEKPRKRKRPEPTKVERNPTALTVPNAPNSVNAVSLHEQVAEKIIEQLRAGTAPWQKPWSMDGVPAFELPYNATTGNRYKGINVLALLVSSYDDPRWVTFKQAAANNWHVKKGEKGTSIQFVKTFDQVVRRDEQGRPKLDENGKEVTVSVKRDKPVITTAKVFNAVQIEGMPELKRLNILELGWNPIERAERLVEAAAPKLHHRAGDNAFYTPLYDLIVLPLREQFKTAGEYYATLLHELGHWTGHADRLDRSLINVFGSQGYGREELRAEIASMLIGQEMHIGHDPGKHVAYIDSWIKALQDNPFEIHSAAADAEKIFNYLLGLEQKREIKADVQEMPLATVPRNNTKPGSLSLTDQINYNSHTYKVHAHLKNGRLKMENLSTGENFILSRADKLYSSLVQAKNNKHQELAHAPLVQQQQDQQHNVPASYGRPKR